MNYKGINFKSRLEAKWAAFFDRCGWRWEYGPAPFSGWAPTFRLTGAKEVIFVAVLPVLDFPQGAASKIEKSDCTTDVLILGTQIPVQQKDDYGIEPWLIVGWLSQYFAEGLEAKPQHCWGEAVLGRWKDGDGCIGFCHSYQSFHDRITGGYDGGCFGELPLYAVEIQNLWRLAEVKIRNVRRRTMRKRNTPCPACGQVFTGRISDHFTNNHPEYKWTREIREGNVSTHYYCSICGHTGSGFCDLVRHYQANHKELLRKETIADGPTQRTKSIGILPLRERFVSPEKSVTLTALDRLLEQVNINTAMLKEEQEKNRALANTLEAEQKKNAELIQKCTEYATRIIEMQNKLAEDTRRRY